MIKLKQIIRYENAPILEATWVDIRPLPDLHIPEVPAVPALFDENGVLVHEAVDAIPASVETNRTEEVVIKCHAYANCQMDMLRADIAELGGDAAEHEALMQEIEATYVPPPPPTAEELRAQAKAARQAAVDAIVVTINGKPFNGDETSQTRMARAIIALQSAGVAQTTWVLADNTVTTVELAELQQALAAAGAEQTRLWVLP